MIQKTCVLVGLAATAFTCSALAAVSAEEAKQLGGPVLTEWGAERAGNKEGTIPAWTGERIKIPASYDPKDPGQYPDPFGDKPLYSITAQNMDKYADKLTEGQKATFKTYPNWRMDIYPTHRTASLPKYVLENSIKNATSCKIPPGTLRMEGCYAGVPFPIPKNGNEVMFNHLVTYSPPFHGVARSWIVDASGKPIQQAELDVTYKFPYWEDTPGTRASNSNFWMLRFDYTAPARAVGQKYVIINSLDAINPGQRVWTYIPGQRRVKLAPDLAYDTPNPASGGMFTMDEPQGFIGAQDRYNFKLIGKKETYLVANAQSLTNYKACTDEKILTPHFPNPDCMRFELHRTWVVEGTLKSGYRHIIPRRVLYMDEDHLQATWGDMYDAAGKLFRVDFSPSMISYYADGGHWLNANDETNLNLLAGGWAHSTALSSPGKGYVADKKGQSDFFFSPEALAGEGIR